MYTICKQLFIYHLIILDLNPTYIKQLYEYNSTPNIRFNNKYKTPFTNKTQVKNSLPISGPKLCNALPLYLRNIKNISLFKHNLKLYLNLLLLIKYVYFIWNAKHSSSSKARHRSKSWSIMILPTVVFNQKVVHDVLITDGSSRA